MNVLVVGGSGRIGSAVCLALSNAVVDSEQPYDVFNADTTEHEMPCVTFIKTDILNQFSVDKAFYTAGIPGGLHAVINCAYPKPQRYMKNPWYITSDQDYLTFFNQHLVSNINLCKRAYEYGVENIILLSSIYGQTIPDDKMYEGSCIKKPPLEYCVSKAGINHLVRYLSKYIHINCISPGGIESPEMDDLFKSRYGKFTNVKEIAGLVKYLLSEEGQGINGQIITVDGGFSI
jgi:NAD(P)-dependent dehydrogenase (short-subunit alcohol dehydrogenase family)